MTMTLEELRESLDVGCLPNTDRPRWFAAIDSAIRERDELRAQRDSAREMHAKRDDEAQFWRASAERAEAELAALKARTQWQAIETAPRDGTWIYVCRAGQPHSGTKVKFSRDCGGCPESWWDGSGFYRNSTFTHWMPLPPPPNVEE